MISVTTWSRLQMHAHVNSAAESHAALGGRKSILLRLAVGRRTEIVDSAIMHHQVRRVDLGLLPASNDNAGILRRMQPRRQRYRGVLPGLRAVRGEGVQQRHLRSTLELLAASSNRLGRGCVLGLTAEARCQSMPSVLEARPVAPVRTMIAGTLGRMQPRCQQQSCVLPGGGSQASRSGCAKFVNQNLPPTFRSSRGAETL